jgi:transposase
MRQNRKQYTAEFKREAVRLAQELDNVAQAARDLGIHESVLHRWKGQLVEHGDEAFPGNGNLRSEAETIRQLRRENEILRQEREILKKTLSIFAQPSSRSLSS